MEKDDWCWKCIQYGFKYKNCVPDLKKFNLTGRVIYSKIFNRYKIILANEKEEIFNKLLPMNTNINNWTIKYFINEILDVNVNLNVIYLFEIINYIGSILWSMICIIMTLITLSQLWLALSITCALWAGINWVVKEIKE